MVTALGIETETKPVHPLKASLLIRETDPGMTTFVNPVKKLHTLMGTILTLLPKIKLVIFLHPPNALTVDVILSALKKTVVSPVQEPKADEPMLVTEEGIVIDDSPVQLRNALSPILTTEFPKVTDVRFEQL